MRIGLAKLESGRHACHSRSKAAVNASRNGWLQLRAAEGDVRCFDDREDFVARDEFHFLDRTRGNDRSDFANACLDNYFTDDFVGHDAFDCSRKLVADALFHKFVKIVRGRSQRQRLQRIGADARL